LAESSSTVQVGGVVGTFADYDGLIAALRERAARLELSYSTVDFGLSRKRSDVASSPKPDRRLSRERGGACEALR
jgi:hypothetical protein